jgi:hypothetical protein
LHDAGIVVSVDPAASVSAVSAKFLDLLENDEGLFARSYRHWGLHSAPEDIREITLVGDRLGMSAIESEARYSAGTAFLHVEQVTPKLLATLVDLGLAVGPYDGQYVRHSLREYGGISVVDSEDGQERARREWKEIEARYSRLTPSSEVWLMMGRRLVRDYTTELCAHFAVNNGLDLITDQEKQVVSTFSMPDEDAQDNDNMVSHSSYAHALGLLTILHIVPKYSLPIEKIAQIRRDHGEEFLAFRALVDQLAGDLSDELKTDSPEIAQAYLDDAVNTKLLAPMRALKRNLRIAGVDAGTAAISVKTEVPALLALAGGAAVSGHPVVAGGAAAAFGMLGVSRELHRMRKKLRAESAAASYLLHVASINNVRNYLHTMFARDQNN